MKETIRALLAQKNAVLLAHNYQPPEIQDLADLCGDSLELSIRAADTDADVIVFAGCISWRRRPRSSPRIKPCCCRARMRAAQWPT
jgi:hypothetical protein